MIITLLVGRQFVPVSWVGLGILVGVGGVAYLASALSLVGAGLIEDAKRSIKVVFKK